MKDARGFTDEAFAFGPPGPGRVEAVIERAIEEAFKLGVEHTVARGEEGRDPSFVNMMPLVLYVDNEADRREMIDAIELFKPGKYHVKIPERRS